MGLSPKNWRLKDTKILGKKLGQLRNVSLIYPEQNMLSSKEKRHHCCTCALNLVNFGPQTAKNRTMILHRLNALVLRVLRFAVRTAL